MRQPRDLEIRVRLQPSFQNNNLILAPSLSIRDSRTLELFFQLTGLQLEKWLGLGSSIPQKRPWAASFARDNPSGSHFTGLVPLYSISVDLKKDFADGKRNF
jgi:hypothetical protein